MAQGRKYHEGCGHFSFSLEKKNSLANITQQDAGHFNNTSNGEKYNASLVHRGTFHDLLQSTEHLRPLCSFIKKTGEGDSHRHPRVPGDSHWHALYGLCHHPLQLEIFVVVCLGCLGYMTRRYRGRRRGRHSGCPSHHGMLGHLLVCGSVGPGWSPRQLVHRRGLCLGILVGQFQIVYANVDAAHVAPRVACPPLVSWSG